MDRIRKTVRASTTAPADSRLRPSASANKAPPKGEQHKSPDKAVVKEEPVSEDSLPIKEEERTEEEAVTKAAVVAFDETDRQLSSQQPQLHQHSRKRKKGVIVIEGSPAEKRPPGKSIQANPRHPHQQHSHAGKQPEGIKKEEEEEEKEEVVEKPEPEPLQEVPLEPSSSLPLQPSELAPSSLPSSQPVVSASCSSASSIVNVED